MILKFGLSFYVLFRNVTLKRDKSIPEHMWESTTRMYKTVNVWLRVRSFLHMYHNLSGKFLEMICETFEQISRCKN